MVKKYPRPNADAERRGKAGETFVSRLMALGGRHRREAGGTGEADCPANALTTTQARADPSPLQADPPLYYQGSDGRIHLLL